MIPLWVFYVFVTTSCIVLSEGIYNSIREFKAKNEIIKMNGNYGNIDKRIWTDKYVHEHYAYDKNNAGCVNKSGVIVAKLRKLVD